MPQLALFAHLLFIQMDPRTIQPTQLVGGKSENCVEKQNNGNPARGLQSPEMYVVSYSEGS